MKNLSINNGTFSAAGNFSGYNTVGVRVHIYKRQMDAMGWSSTEDVEFPFYVIADYKTVQSTDDAGTPVGDASERLTALSVFKTKKDMTQAHVDNATLDIEIKKSIADEAAKVGLDTVSIEALMSAIA
jgi:hypothetical protein